LISNVYVNDDEYATPPNEYDSIKFSFFKYLNLFNTLIGRPPPHGLSRGNFSLSRRSTLKPFSERNFAAVEPAGPAPTTITSYIMFLAPLHILLFMA
jgi:hypothetical protein